MAFAEDLAPFFADYGIAATVAGVSLRGIFDNAFASVLGITAGSSPMLVVKLADVPAVAVGDAVVFATGSYTVADIEPDGTGIVVLRLK